MRRRYTRQSITNATFSYIFFQGHPGLDLDVGEFLDGLQLNNLKDIFEKEQVGTVKSILDVKCTEV